MSRILNLPSELLLSPPQPTPVKVNYETELEAIMFLFDKSYIKWL